MSKSWYYQHDDQIQGPYTIEEMKRLASEGLLEPSALLLRMGDTPDDALTAAKVLGAACFSRGAADALLSAGTDSDPLMDAGPRTPPPPPKKKPAPAAPAVSPKSKPTGEERRPKVVMRIKKKPKKPVDGSTPPPPIAPPVAPPIAPPVEKAPAPQASDLPEAETFIDPVDFLIGDFFAPPAKQTPPSKTPERSRQPAPPPGARPRPIDPDSKPLSPLAMPIEAPPVPQPKKSPPLAMPVEAPPVPKAKKAPPPLAMPVEAPPVPQSKKPASIPPPMPEAETFIDPLDFLNDAILPPPAPEPLRPSTPVPPRIDKPRQPAPAPQTPQVPFNEAFRKARVAVDVWLDEDENRDLVRTNDIELIRSQPEIDAIFARNEDYGPEMSDRLLQHLRFMTENRARYYNARPND